VPDAGTPIVEVAVSLPPIDCTLPPVPVSFTELEGFSDAEDFLFDEQGRYVGAGFDGNLVRIPLGGPKQLWRSDIDDTAGVVLLPDGSVLYCETEEGTLRRVYPNGSVTVVLGGLLYPNGMDLGPDGFVYVAENSGGRVRRVNPDTGEFSIVALGLQSPNGVAVGADPSLLYVGSFDGGGVYEVKLGAPGQLGQARVLVRLGSSELAEPAVLCPEQQPGVSCTPQGEYQAGECRRIANVVDCMPIDPCPGLADGEYCSYPLFGECHAGRCEEQPEPCAGLVTGAACEIFEGFAGVCTAYDEQLYCEPPNACSGLEVGASCVDFFGPGTCMQWELAEPAGPDVPADAGAPAVPPVYCAPPNPCAEAASGDACEDYSVGAGVCQGKEGALNCLPANVCEGQSEGAVCEDAFYGPGRCKLGPCEESFYGWDCAPGGQILTCSPASDCTGLTDDTPCSHPELGSGVCRHGACSVPSYPSHIDGMGVDACGNVYATEYIVGVIWRISPSGAAEQLAKVPSRWIPNVEWGRDVGGFSREVLYVADRDLSRLFAVSVGIPSAAAAWARAR
jgi:sugar lactone lactonase YvrE